MKPMYEWQAFVLQCFSDVRGEHFVRTQAFDRKEHIKRVQKRWNQIENRNRLSWISISQNKVMAHREAMRLIQELNQSRKKNGRKGSLKKAMIVDDLRKIATVCPHLQEVVTVTLNNYSKFIR